MRLIKKVLTPPGTALKPNQFFGPSLSAFFNEVKTKWNEAKDFLTPDSPEGLLTGTAPLPGFKGELVFGQGKPSLYIEEARNLSKTYGAKGQEQLMKSLETRPYVRKAPKKVIPAEETAATVAETLSPATKPLISVRKPTQKEIKLYKDVGTLEGYDEAGRPIIRRKKWAPEWRLPETGATQQYGNLPWTPYKEKPLEGNDAGSLEFKKYVSSVERDQAKIRKRRINKLKAKTKKPDGDTNK